MTPLADAAAGMVETPEEVAVLADGASNIESADFLRSSHLLQPAATCISSFEPRSDVTCSSGIGRALQGPAVPPC